MTKLSKNYTPSESEEYMNANQLAYFKNKLETWKNDLLKESEQTLDDLQESSIAAPDESDRATIEADHTLELRTQDRLQKLLKKIDEALYRIDTGSYGYCLETGEPIGLKRLEARPIATLTVDAQEMHEKKERMQNA